jgi:cytochrome P450
MWAELAGAAATQRQLIVDAVEAKKSSRGSDLISALLDARDKGTEFTDDQIVQLAEFIIAAGIDTTGSLLASTFAFLTERLDIRERLIENPKLTVAAFEEFTRFFAPTQALCRTVTRDTVLGGQSLRRGDRVMLCYAAACRDPREFANADEFVLDRKPNLHLAFGGGNHRCLGSLFARLEFEIVTNTVLRRMRDFRVDLDAVRSFDHVGVVTGFKRVPATFTPGSRLGIDPHIPGWTG